MLVKLNSRAQDQASLSTRAEPGVNDTNILSPMRKKAPQMLLRSDDPTDNPGCLHQPSLLGLHSLPVAAKLDLGLEVPMAKAC